ncbi:MAG: EscI/YscI/HrpB family type secretion system inner rod protein [Proteobacteria bacterium]|nr:EscI/YscI/HrpB family type secretion system inner rod protein [Pseudomonadota bacterium]
MEIVASKIVQSVLTTDTPAVSASSVVPDSRATERFNEIMQSDPVVLVTTQQVQLPVVANPMQVANLNLGDRILNGLQGVSTDFQQSWKNVTAVLEGGNTMTAADLLKMQMNLTQMSIQYDLVGKVISRSTQNIEQLVKIQ